jgi:predicted glycogen debranching enzyme
MKVGKLKLDLKEGLKKEWIITNGIGGFASSTIIGANTRRYHGLLIAPINPPAERHLILSKVDENLKISGKDYTLYTNICKNYVSNGYKHLESFEKEYFPIFSYQVEDVKIEKKISMVYGKNTTVISYLINNGRKESIFTLAPIVNFRDFHSMTTNKEFKLSQKIDGTKIKIIVDENKNYPIYMNISEGTYSENINDTFKNMYYLKEEERGFSAEENLTVSGKYEIKIAPKEVKKIDFIVSLNEKDLNLNVDKVFEDEINRLNLIIENSGIIKEKKKYTRPEKEKNQVLKDLIITSDSFIIERKKWGTKSVIAGYPWFLDWGRDTFIAFEGLLLCTKRFQDAKDVIRTFIKDINSGLVPNGYGEADGKPLYNSVDASLLLFEVVNKYLAYTKDYDFVKEEVYDKLKDIVQNYTEGTNLDNNNIYIDEDGLLNSGTPTTQNTWMDAKIGDYVVTPRNGKVVEINALWYNSLKTLEDLAKKFADKEVADNCKKMAKNHKKQFVKKFYNPKKKCLYDVLGDDKIRPNQLFAISTTYPVLDVSSTEAKNVFETCTNKLLLTHGLKTLARGEFGYVANYEGDCHRRDMSYHQGPSWPWLLGLYLNSFENILKAKKNEQEKDKLQKQYDKFVDDIYVTFKKEIYAEEGICTISEIYNSKLPYTAGGTFSQAWSVSEVLRIILKRKK